MRLITSSKLRRTMLSTIVILTALSAVGCTSSQQKTEYSLSTSQEHLLIPADIAEFLSHSATDSSAAFARSPWGDNITLSAQAPYFSASGAECRQLIVEKAISSTGLACTQNNQDWYKSRALTAGVTQ
ncbi:DVU3141 family protein [Neptunomonas japonica]|uniref:DVU3141 family protein n=1 Tax=Neptunomonas japonica TaxID=417574 RepID=UPI0006869167|nr:DVU3141 family protein [Neptunomonas japonica]